MVMSFDTTATFDAAAMCRSVTYPDVARPEEACRFDWNWFRFFLLTQQTRIFLLLLKVLV